MDIEDRVKLLRKRDIAFITLNQGLSEKPSLLGLGQ